MNVDLYEKSKNFQNRMGCILSLFSQDTLDFILHFNWNEIFVV